MNRFNFVKLSINMKDYRFPAKLKPLVASFLLSCIMSLLVSGIAMLQTFGLNPGFMQHWMRAWLFSWTIAFPSVVIVAPLVEQLLPSFVKEP